MGKALQRTTNRRVLLVCIGLLGTGSALAKSPDARPRAWQPQDSTVNPLLTVVTVVDENREPLAGVEVSARQHPPAVTDALGQAKVAATKGDTLRLQAFGTLLQQVVVGTEGAPTVALSTRNPAVARLKTVPLLYSTTRRDLTATSTQTIYNSSLRRFPVASFLNTLSGQLAGLSTAQFSGQPGNDTAFPTLLGQGPLLVIDGIPRALTVFDLEEIESVTVLKDALSTAMLGVRASNGVIQVTTRKGTPSQPRISFTVQSAIQQPIKMPKALNAYNYALLNNEARANDGLAPVYSAADLQKYQDGSDPIGHPDVDWRSLVLKSSSRLDRYTFSATGGNSFSRYFVSLEHLSQSGLLNTSDINAYNTSNTFKSYNIRSNVDLQLSSKLSAGIHLLGRILDTNDPGAGTGNILTSLLNTPNNAYPIYNANNSYAGNQQFQSNIWAQTVGSGYQTNYKRDMLADFYLTRTLNEVTPGLYLRAVGSYYANVSENILRSKPIAVYQLGANGSYQQFGTLGDQINTSNIDAQGRTDYLELTAGYDRQFGAHGLSATLLGNRQNSVTDLTGAAIQLPYTITGTSGRAAYNFQEKYVAELAFGLNGSNRYPGSANHTKYGFFPAAGLAWNISREDFLKSYTWLSYLKLYGSYGKTGNDNPGYFNYIQRYAATGQPFFGTGAGNFGSLSEQQLANPNITWEKANKLSAGVQSAFFDNHLSLTVEYYNSKYYDLLMQRGRSTTLLGQAYPNENIGQNRYQGFTGQLSFQQGTQNFSYYVAANVGLQTSKVLYMDEVFRPYTWMQRTGQQVGQLFGYQSEGLFQSAADIANHATLTGYKPQPGDIKYKDLNGDGVIDQFDVAPIGTTDPLVPFGVDFGFRYRGFDVGVLLQGVLNRTVYLQGGSEYAFQNNGFGQAFEQHLDRWTPSNPDATYPRLSIGANVNNQAVSSFWLHRADFVRLKSVEVGYTLPLGLTSRAHLQTVRVFASGLNLLTISEYSRIDPEVFNNAYPQQRLFNLGLNFQL